MQLLQTRIGVEISSPAGKMSLVDINSEEQRGVLDQEAHKNSHTTGTILDTTPVTTHTNGAANPHQIISRLHAQQKLQT
jgi:hypothetical protein